ncbi:MAG: hypothetical protein LBU64_02825 [Planctomycetota bacterium]|nr:hypothetical protein [Planctomycetota bacterium]
MKTTPAEVPSRNAREHFNDLRPGESRDLGFCRICEVTMGVCRLRMKKDDELMILGYWA